MPNILSIINIINEEPEKVKYAIDIDNIMDNNEYPNLFLLKKFNIMQ